MPGGQLHPSTHFWRQPGSKLIDAQLVSHLFAQTWYFLGAVQWTPIKVEGRPRILATHEPLQLSSDLQTFQENLPWSADQ
jgi:hypothetical protein